VIFFLINVNNCKQRCKQRATFNDHFVPFYTILNFLSKQRKTPPNLNFLGLAAHFYGAANQIRTGDLVLTKDVLCQLSHSSILATRIGIEPTTSSVTG
jgi:hypothetical protein